MLYSGILYYNTGVKCFGLINLRPGRQQKINWSIKGEGAIINRY